MANDKKVRGGAGRASGGGSYAKSQGLGVDVRRGEVFLTEGRSRESILSVPRAIASPKYRLEAERYVERVGKQLAAAKTQSAFEKTLTDAERVLSKQASNYSFGKPPVFPK